MPDSWLERGAFFTGFALIALLLVLVIRGWGEYGARLDRAVAGGGSVSTVATQTSATDTLTTETSPRSDRSEPTWIGSFETGDFSQWDGIQAADVDRITTVLDPVRDGRYAARFELRPGDLRSGGSERAELVQTTAEGEGVESWWAWSVYFPADDFVPTPNDQVIFTQWHDTGSEPIPPPVLFTVIDEGGSQHLDFRVRGGDPKAADERHWELGSLERDHWYDFTFHVKWSSEQDGFVELWLDGDKVVPKTEMPTLYTGLSNYLKQGNSRHAFDRTSVLYLDGTVRGRTRAAVS